MYSQVSKTEIRGRESIYYQRWFLIQMVLVHTYCTVESDDSMCEAQRQESIIYGLSQWEAS